MRILDTIQVREGRRLDLCQGDLTDLARSEWFDAIVVSAFAGDYTPSAHSLVGALERSGVSVAELASDIAIDYRRDYGTWLSAPVVTSDPGIGFGRIICFEPNHLGLPPEVVGHLFRALIPIVATEPDIKSLAMSVLSTGDIGFSTDEMLPPILDAAASNLAHGLPINRIAIVVNNAAAVPDALCHFGEMKSRVGTYDVFVSYSQKDTVAADGFVAALRECRPETDVFVDRLEIDHGAAWQRRVFESLERCRTVVCMLTPNYLDSDICLEELNIAWMRSRGDDVVLRPLFVADADLPTWIRSRQYLDCREFDAGKLAHAAASVADALR